MSLRGLDGKGGTFAKLPTKTAGDAGSLNLGACGLVAQVSSTFSFVYSSLNIWTGGGGTMIADPLPWTSPVACGETQLQTAYLALVNEVGGVELLARLTALPGLRCE